MASILNADNGVVSGTSGLKYTSDNSGVIQLQTSGATTLTLDTSKNAVFANAANVTGVLNAGNTVVGTLAANATTITGNLSVTGYTSFTGNVDISSSDSNPVRIISTSGTTYLRIRTANTTTTYSYIALDNTSSSQGLGYIIKNGNSNGNGLANGSLYLWNDQGTDNGIEFVANGTIGTRTSLIANGSFVIRGALGVGNGAPYMSNWGANTDSIVVGGSKAYAAIHLIGKNNGNTAWSSGVGDSLYYLAYDDVNSNHCLTVTQTGAIVLRSANVNANGTGIVFPQAQSQSSDPNTLDDYEEGTWTPTDGSGAGLTFLSGNSGRYTKIGRCVFIDCEVPYPTNSSGATATIANLPFNSKATTDYNSGTGMSDSNINFWSFINQNVSQFTLYKQAATFTQVSNAELSGKTLYISLWYLTAY